MFEPDDPRYQQILELADLAVGPGLMDFQRPKWRELVTGLLGSIRDPFASAASNRRQHLRAPLELQVDILAPEELASVAASSIGSGGISLKIAEIIPAGTPIDLSIKVPERRVPLLVQAQVVWSREGELGAAFTNLFQNDRELLEGLAVKALVADEKT